MRSAYRGKHCHKKSNSFFGTHEFLPILQESASNEKIVVYWFLQNDRIQDRADNHYIKEDVVLYAGTTWFKEFSRKFDATVSAGPKLPKVAVGLAINSRGITVYHKDNEKALPLLGLDFSQMKKVKSERFVFPEADLHFCAGLAIEKIIWSYCEISWWFLWCELDVKYSMKV